MSIIRKMRKQKAVWWEREATPDRFGTFTFTGPAEIDCRWDDSQSEYRDASGQVVISQATIYPDRVLKPGDKLRKGAMASDEPEDPTEVVTAFEVQRFEEIPNLKNTETLYMAHLRYGQR